MSQSATRFGQRVRRARKASASTSPPERSAARMVPRQSAIRPRASTRVRRLAIGRTGSASRAMARRAAASSAVDICSKSIAFRRSAAEKVRVASTSTCSRLGLLLPGRGLGVDQRLRRPPLGRLRVGALVEAAEHRREQAYHVLEELRVAPEQAEDLGEDRPLLRAADEAGLERVVEVAPVAEAHRLDGADRVDHPAGADRHAGAAQRAGEVGDVVDELAVLGDRQRGVPPSPAITPARARPWPGRGCAWPPSPASGRCRPGT